MHQPQYRPGACPTQSGVCYSVWAPEAQAVKAIIKRRNGAVSGLALVKDPAGYWNGRDGEGEAGDQYQYSLDGEGNFPDPFSRAQAKDVHGDSVVIDPGTYGWRDAAWERPPFRELIIYELHVGTFTSEGTFAAAARVLPRLKNLGINAIELMPVADFPGRWNWGYDGVLPYAPAHCYGSPDQMRGLVDAAHALGIAVILDVVYNHFGPAGNYLARFSRSYFHPTYQTPWGSAFNFDGPMSGPVRAYFSRNPIYWMEEFHIDGFRFDAAHEIQDHSDRHIVAEMADLIHKMGGYAVAEDARNDSKTLTSGEGWGLNAVWADDFHHSIRVSQTSENTGYFSNFDGSLGEVVDTLKNGWHYRGNISKSTGKPRGTPCRHLPPEKFIHCISNHDQAGNRAHGDRLHHSISPARYRAISALICLTPYTPLLFMGQEWAASSPFLFFTDHETALGKLITAGRRKEFSDFPEFTESSDRAQIPDPQSKETFLRSKLKWKERKSGIHAQILALYREALRLRRQLRPPLPPTRKSWTVRVLDWGIGALDFSSMEEHSLLLFDLTGGHRGPLPYDGSWKVLLSTESHRFGGKDDLQWDPGSREVTFECPGVLLLERQPGSGGSL